MAGIRGWGYRKTLDIRSDHGIVSATEKLAERLALLVPFV